MYSVSVSHNKTSKFIGDVISLEDAKKLVKKTFEQHYNQFDRISISNKTSYSGNGSKTFEGDDWEILLDNLTERDLPNVKPLDAILFQSYTNPHLNLGEQIEYGFIIRINNALNNIILQEFARDIDLNNKTYIIQDNIYSLDILQKDDNWLVGKNTYEYLTYAVFGACLDILYWIWYEGRNNFKNCIFADNINDTVINLISKDVIRQQSIDLKFDGFDLVDWQMLRDILRQLLVHVHHGG